MIVVELNEEDARLFTMFQEHHDFIKLLKNIGVFNIKNGSVTVHFSHVGEIVSVDKQEHFSPHIKESYAQVVYN
jgi:hypothetical protein